MAEQHKGTSTSSFGVGRRENHDASGFYARFTPPVLSGDQTVNPPESTDVIHLGDARDIDRCGPIKPASVALVVTSPPYFAGKEYEEALGQGHIPASYLDYLEMLHDVFAECVEKLEPGGRIAVNVANLGRKPYRSLSADVIAILQDRLGLLMRGEIIWQKGRGTTGSCAWGSFQSPANPVLRDLTERVVVVSKGRFDRALSRRERADLGLPADGSMFRDDFMEATTDVWEIPAESAVRVGHPAPFPVALPQRLIELYTYRGDLVLDPFMGSGTTAIAALRTERHFVGFDTDPDYVTAATERVEVERARLRRLAQPVKVVLPAIPGPADKNEDPLARAVREGRKAKEIARVVLEGCGFTDIRENCRFPSGVEVNFVARGSDGHRWFFDVSGAFTTSRGGLRRTDTLWKALGRAAVLRAGDEGDARLVLVTTDLPDPSSAGATALRCARDARVVFDAVEMLSAEGQARLRTYALGGADEPMGDVIPDKSLPEALTLPVAGVD